MPESNLHLAVAPDGAGWYPAVCTTSTSLAALAAAEEWSRH